MGKKGGACEWEATTARRLNADLIVCAQRVNMKEWERTSSLSSFYTSSSLVIATEDGRNMSEEEGSCLGTVFSGVPSSSNTSKSSSSSKNNKSSSPIINWSSPKYWPFMAAALNNVRDLESSNEEDPSPGDLMAKAVPRSTLQNAVNMLGDKAITLENYFPLFLHSLLSHELVFVFQDITWKRDKGNNSVLREDTIQLIVDLGGASSDKQAENGLDYLTRMGRIDKVNRNGRFVSAQATTTERSQINVAQQYRRHFLIESEWKEMCCKNLPPALFEKFFPRFMKNLDKTCMMCSDGVLKVMGNKYQNQDKNV